MLGLDLPDDAIQPLHGQHGVLPIIAIRIHRRLDDPQAAFVGDDDAYQQAYDMFLEPPFEVKKPTLFAYWPKRPSLMSNKQLDESIRRIFDETFIAALARGAELAGTGICSGEGGMLPEEQADSKAQVMPKL